MVDNIISSLGGGSGVNTSELVESLVAAERSAPEARLDSKKAKLEAQLSGYGVLSSAISTFQENLALLKDADTFNAKTVAFPNTDVVTPVEIQPNALAGDYSIEVLDVAQAHSLTSASFSSTSETIGKGTLTFNFGTWDDGVDPVGTNDGFTRFSEDESSTGETITIDDSNNTLTGLRDAINDADFGVQASIVADGDGYRLLITAPSGASNELEIVVAEDETTPTNNDASGLSLFAFNTSGSQLTTSQSGADARLKVNGFEVTRSNNQVDDVVEGLEFTLNKASEGEVISFSISSDTTGAEDVINNFVTSYNDFLSAINGLTGTATDEEDTSVGSLRTDSTAKGLLSQVRSLISSTVTGADSTFNALAFVGVKTELDGSLSIDSDTFDEAMEDDYDKIVDLFTPSASSTSSLIEVAQFKDETAAGTYAVNITADPTKGNLVTDTIVNNGAAFDYSSGSFSTTFTPSSPDYDFTVTVDGTTSNTLSLIGSFDTLEEVRAELQSIINADSELQDGGAAVDVTIVGDTLQFESRAYGTSSKVTFGDQGAGISNLGFGNSQGTTSTGSDVAGTIDGVTAFGSGNILLPEFGSDLAGLSLRVTPGATTANVTYTQGFATQLNNLFEDYLSTSGMISERQSTINDQLEDVEDDRDTLDARMEKRFALLQAQFIQMEAIVTALNSTRDSLDGLLGSLPFTASNDS